MTKVIIMAGGKGSRLMPLTKNTPKPLLKVNGQPMIYWIMKRFIDQGFNDFVISIGYLGSQIRDYLEQEAGLDCRIAYLEESAPLGTAGALSLLKEASESFFVINGDVLVSANYNDMLKYHESHNAIATVGATTHSVEIPYGVLEMDNYALKEIREKPVINYPISAGVYVFSVGALFLLKKGYLDMPDFIDGICQQFHIMVFPISGDWIDCGTHKDYERAIGL